MGMKGKIIVTRGERLGRVSDMLGAGNEESEVKDGIYRPGAGERVGRPGDLGR